MKIGLERGSTIYITGGFLLCGWAGLLFLWLLIESFRNGSFQLQDLALVPISIGMLYAAIAFAKTPFKIISFDPTAKTLTVPYWDFEDKSWDGTATRFKFFARPFYYYRRHIRADEIKWIFICHYADVPKIVKNFSSDVSAIKKISESLGKPLSSYAGDLTITSIGLGAAGGLARGNAAAGAAGGLAGGIAGSLALSYAEKHDYFMGIRLENELILDHISFERHRADCEPFAAYLKNQGIKVVEP